MKIDVEGYELLVVQGMMETLKVEQPILLIEMEGRHNTQGFSRTFDTLASIGYSPFCSQDGKALQRLSVPRPELVQAEAETARYYFNKFSFLQLSHMEMHASLIAGN